MQKVNVVFRILPRLVIASPRLVARFTTFKQRPRFRRPPLVSPCIKEKEEEKYQNKTSQNKLFANF
jgi:hypothetical protein